MTRHIKFRAWACEKMFEVESLSWDGDDLFEVVEKTKRHQYFNEADPIILMQFTGLKDCEGVDIYDGDILLTPLHPTIIGAMKYKSHQLKAVVYWDGEECMFWWKDTQTGESYDFLELAYGAKQCEVVGNIHQNPELLEE